MRPGLLCVVRVTNTTTILRKLMLGVQVWPQRESYTYDFVPLSLGRTIIHRDDTDSSSFASYSPPYEDFPPLCHSCHPYFVIFSAIQAYEAHVHKELPDKHWERYAKLRLIASLWEDLRDFPLDENALPSLLEDQSNTPSSPPGSIDGSQGIPTANPALDCNFADAAASDAPRSAASSSSSSASSSSSSPPPAAISLSSSQPIESAPTSGPAASTTPKNWRARAAADMQKSTVSTAEQSGRKSGRGSTSLSTPSDVRQTPSHAGTGVPAHTNNPNSMAPLPSPASTATTNQTTGSVFDAQVPALPSEPNVVLISDMH